MRSNRAQHSSPYTYRHPRFASRFQGNSAARLDQNLHSQVKILPFQMESSVFRIHHLLVVGAIGFSFAACGGGGGGSAGRNTEDPPLEPIIPSTVHVIEGEAANTVVVENGRLIFPSEGNELIQQRTEGDILVGRRQSTDEGYNPYGFLRKVEAIEVQDDSIIVKTSPATLEDAIEQGEARTMESIPIPTRFEDDALPAASVSEDDNLVFPGLHTNGSGGLAGGEINVSGKLLGGLGGGGVSVTVSRGSFNFTPDVDMGIKIKWFKVQEFHLILSGEMAVELALMVKSTLATSKTWDGTLVPPKTKILPPLMIGPVPVEVTMVVSVKGGAELSVSGEQTVEAGAGAKSSVKLGGIYEKGAGWSKVAENSFDLYPIGPTIESKTNSSIKGFVPKVSIGFLIYDTAGPVLSVNPYAKFTLSSTVPCPWDIKGGVEGSLTAQAQVPILGIELANSAALKLFDYDSTLLEGELPEALCGVEDAGVDSGPDAADAGPDGSAGAAGAAGSGGSSAQGGSGGSTSTGGSAGAAGTAGSAGMAGASGTGGSTATGGSGGDTTSVNCMTLAEQNGWDNMYCEFGGNNACQGMGPETSDCDHCCTGYSCIQLVRDKEWTSLRCEVDGKNSCGGLGAPTFDCDACCGSTCTNDEDCGSGVCAWNGMTYCCRAAGAEGETCFSSGGCNDGEVCAWNGTKFVCTTPECSDISL